MIRLILLISIIFVGCKPSDNPIFKLPEGLTPEQTAQRLSIKLDKNQDQMILIPHSLWWMQICQMNLCTFQSHKMGLIVRHFN